MSVCFECGEPAEVDHHVVPRSRGGTKTVPLCGKCHGKAHHNGRSMTTSQLTKDALDRKRARGEATGGRVPFGMQRVGKYLTKNNHEQRIIAEVLAMRARGWTLRQIADDLHSRGIASKCGGQWHPKTISDIVTRNAGKAGRVL